MSEPQETRKPNRFRITSIIIAIVMVVSSLVIMLANPSTVSAFPTANPQPSDYLFYDDFENSTGTPNWSTDASKHPVFSNTHTYHGSYALKFDPTSVGANQNIDRFLSYDSPINEGIVVETKFYDDASDTSAECWLFTLAGSGYATCVGVGVRTASSTINYVYKYANTTPTYTYQVTGIDRTTGWHDLKILLKNHTDYSIYIDNNFVGSLVVSSGTGGVGALLYAFSSALATPSVIWIDDYMIYKLTQDEIWTRKGIAIDVGLQWKSGGVGESNLLYESGIWKMWYDAIDEDEPGQYGRLGYATSSDGYSWTDYVGNPIANLSVGYRTFLLKIDSTYYMYYTNETTGYYMRMQSTDGLTWTNQGTTNLGLGGTGTWDHNTLGNIDVWVEGSTWYTLYEAKNSTSTWRFGLATSTDGITWTKSLSNPVSPSDMMAGGVEVHKFGSTYYVLCHGLLPNGYENTPNDIFLLQSTNLINWYRNTFFSQMTRQIGNAKETPQIADPSYESAVGKNLMSYSAADSGSGSKCNIFIAESKYTLEQIVAGQILQSGTHLMGDIGVKNNVTSSGKYWYSGINAMKGTYTNNLSLTTTQDVNITITTMEDEALNWTADSGVSSPTVNYNISGVLETEKTYYITLDGELYDTIESSALGTVLFSYSGSGGSHTFTINDEFPNYPPYFTSSPEETGYNNTLYYYDANAIDPESQSMTFTLTGNGTDWLSYGSSNGTVWGIAPSVGWWNCNLSLSDGVNEVWQNYSLTVLEYQTYGGTISSLVQLILIMLVIGVVAVLATQGIIPMTKKNMLPGEMIRNIINMFIYIVISLAIIGVAYSMFG